MNKQKVFHLQFAVAVEIERAKSAFSQRSKLIPIFMLNLPGKGELENLNIWTWAYFAGEKMSQKMVQETRSANVSFIALI